MHTVYFDLETKYAAEEVGGWSHIAEMGMSCGVIADEQGKHIYLEHEVHELIEHLHRAELIVGFNHVKFDLRVLSAYMGKQEYREQCYQALCALNHCDMLLELEKILGHRLKLDSLARATLGEGKSAHGLQALQWHREGRMDLVIEYCKQDVTVTQRIHQYALEHGKLLYESRGSLKEVQVNWLPPTPADAAVSEQMALF